MYFCAICPKDMPCNRRETENLPPSCPCFDEEIAEKSRQMYLEDEDDFRMAKISTQVGFEANYMRTRLEETMEFAGAMGYKHIGIVHCLGLKKEAAVVYEVFKANGFKVDAIGCKAGSPPRTTLGEDECFTCDGMGELCNPLGQTLYVEKCGCQFVVIMGLCVGHDTLFMKHCKVPMTYLVIKDAVLGHNPVQAIYTSDIYYKKKLFPPTRKRGSLRE